MIIDKLIKLTHFLLVKTTYEFVQYAQIYISEIVQLHGVPVSIISNHGLQFIDRFERAFQKVIGTQVALNTTFYPQIN